MHQIIGALQYLKKSKTLWENALGVTLYQNCILQACDFIRQGLCRRFYRFLILKAVPKDYFCLLTIFLKAITMHSKKDWEKTTYKKTQTATRTNKQTLNTTNTFPLKTSCFP